MIISHSHQFIFLKPRKVAGTSLEISFSKFLDANDIVTRISQDDEEERLRRGYLGARNYRKSVFELFTNPTVKDFKSLARLKPPQKFYNHISAAQVEKMVGPEIWDNYKKISVVRNPWDYAVSYFFYANGKETKLDFEHWCVENAGVLKRNIEQYQVNNEVIIDHFLRFEHFQEDMLALEASIPGLTGLHDTFSSVTAKGGTRPKKGATVQEIFGNNPRLDDLFEELFAFEIEQFQYTRL
jgi:hypothetical protein